MPDEKMPRPVPLQRIITTIYVEESFVNFSNRTPEDAAKYIVTQRYGEDIEIETLTRQEISPEGSYAFYLVGIVKETSEYIVKRAYLELHPDIMKLIKTIKNKVKPEMNETEFISYLLCMLESYKAPLLSKIIERPSYIVSIIAAAEALRASLDVEDLVLTPTDKIALLTSMRAHKNKNCGGTGSFGVSYGEQKPGDK